jgi:hypothetical protein
VTEICNRLLGIPAFAEFDKPMVLDKQLKDVMEI